MAKNCWIIADGFGYKNVHAVTVVMGLSIISDEYAARRHRTMHPWKQTSGSFTLEITHSNDEEYVSFNEWMKVYVERIINPDNNVVGPMRVVIESRNFDKLAIPAGGIEFGDRPQRFVKTQTIDFKGASDAIDLESIDLNLISAAYHATYYEPGGNPGDYLTSYAIGSVGDAVFDRDDETTYDPSRPASPFYVPGNVR